MNTDMEVDRSSSWMGMDVGIRSDYELGVGAKAMELGAGVQWIGGFGKLRVD